MQGGHERTKNNTTLDAVILHRLMDGKIHKRKELSQLMEIDERSVTRSLARLDLYFVIHRKSGRGKDSGIRLDGRHLYYGLTPHK